MAKKIKKPWPSYKAPPSRPIPRHHRAAMDKIKAKPVIGPKVKPADEAWAEADQELRKEERQRKIDALQNERDALIVESFKRVLKCLASIHGGFFSAEEVRLTDGLRLIKVKMDAIS